MDLLITVFISYFFCACLHVLVHRILARFHFKSFITMGIFTLGLWYLIFMQGMGWWDLLYIFLSLLHFIFYTSPYFGERGPSSVILDFVKDKKRVSEAELYSLFSNRELIGVRISDLMHSGHIYEKKERFYISQKGRFLVYLMDKYRKFFAWNEGG